MGARRLLTPEEAGGLLGVSADRVTTWCRKGILPGLRMGRIWRIDRQELEGWQQKGRAQDAWQGTLGELAAGTPTERTPETLSVAQAAQMLHVSVRTVQEHATALGASKVRRRWRIPYESVRRAQREGLPHPEHERVQAMPSVVGAEKPPMVTSQRLREAGETSGAAEPDGTGSPQAAASAPGRPLVITAEGALAAGESEGQELLLLQLGLAVGAMMGARAVEGGQEGKSCRVRWQIRPETATGEAETDRAGRPDGVADTAGNTDGDLTGVMLAVTRRAEGGVVRQGLAVVGYDWDSVKRVIRLVGPYEPDMTEGRTLALLGAYREMMGDRPAGEMVNAWVNLGNQRLPGQAGSEVGGR